MFIMNNTILVCKLFRCVIADAVIFGSVGGVTGLLVVVALVIVFIK